MHARTVGRRRRRDVWETQAQEAVQAGWWHDALPPPHQVRNQLQVSRESAMFVPRPCSESQKHRGMRMQRLTCTASVATSPSPQLPASRVVRPACAASLQHDQLCHASARWPRMPGALQMACPHACWGSERTESVDPCEAGTTRGPAEGLRCQRERDANINHGRRAPCGQGGHPATHRHAHALRPSTTALPQRVYLSGS